MRSRCLAVLLGICFAVGCSAGGSYVWVQALPPELDPDEYVIGSGDVISIRVYNQDALATRGRVRSDGKIALPLVGDLDVRGKHPAALGKEVETALKGYIVSPIVTVTVEEMQPTSVSVFGEVAHPGVYTLDPAAGVLQALAAAGGLTEYASNDCIYVLRRAPQRRIRFTLASLVQQQGRAATFRVRAGDVVVVE